MIQTHDWTPIPLPERLSETAFSESLSEGSNPLRERLYTLTQLENLPQVKPLIEDTIPLGGVSLLAGTHSTGKSFVALSMGCSVHTGAPWYGRPVERRKTLYLAGEGPRGLRKRVRAWEAYHETTIGDDFQIYDGAVQLVDPAQVEHLENLIRDDGFGFVIVDTLAKSTIGIEENSNSDMSRAVDALYRIQRATGDGSVLTVHHTGKDGLTVRGASALEAGLDTVYLSTKKGESFQIERKKNKDGPVSDLRTFDLIAIPENAGPVLKPKTASDTLESNRKVSSALSDLCRDGKGVVQAELLKASGLKRATFVDAVNRLVSAGEIHREGTGATTRYWLKGEEPF